MRTLRAAARRKGGRCLSDCFTHLKDLYQWECRRGHTWKSAGLNIIGGTWCPVCACGGNTMETVRQFVAAKGGKCLLRRYVDNKTPLRLECALGHRWKASFANIKDRHSWCPRCASTRLTLNVLRAVARERGGRCLSRKYCGTLIQHDWECKYGHRWKATPARVRAGTWCPACARVGYTIEEVQQFVAAKGGKCLSRRYVNNSTPLRLECALGHRWQTPFQNIRSGTWCPRCAGNQPLTLKELRAIARARGGRCLSREYRGSFVHHEWECRYGHRWKAIPSSVKLGTWCPDCAGTKRKTLKEMQDLAAQHGGKCLSEEYVNMRTPLWWECAQGHVFQKTPESAKYYGNWCRRCWLNSRKKKTATIRKAIPVLLTGSRAAGGKR